MQARSRRAPHRPKSQTDWSCHCSLPRRHTEAKESPGSLPRPGSSRLLSWPFHLPSVRESGIRAIAPFTRLACERAQVVQQVRALFAPNSENRYGTDAQSATAANREAFKLSRTIDGDGQDLDFEQCGSGALCRDLRGDSLQSYT